MTLRVESGTIFNVINFWHMQKITEQINFWSGRDGNSYTDRNPQSVKELDGLYKKQYGVLRTAMNRKFLSGISKDVKILEVGANIGLQLELLRKMGFTNLLGIEVNEYAVEAAKKIHPKIDIIKGSAFDLPFKKNYFDLVFTSGVLIHIAPKDVKKATKEIVRVSGGYIWGMEYYAPKLTDIEYRGKKGFLWKRDFCDFYLKNFSDLKLAREEKYKMNDGNASQMFLLKK